MNNLILNSAIGVSQWFAIAVMVIAVISIPTLWWYGMSRALSIRKADAKTRIHKLPFKFESFLKIIGGIENVIVAKAETSKIKIEIKELDKVDLDLLKSLKSVSGTFQMSDSITIILGPSSKTLATQLNDTLLISKKS